VEIPPSSHWARCGDVVGVSMQGVDECWLGVIRSMHADWGRSLHAEIAILGRDSQAVELRVVSAEGEENVFSEATRAISTSTTCARSFLLDPRQSGG